MQESTEQGAASASSLSEKTRALLISRIGKDAAQHFEDEVFRLLPVLRDEVEFGRMPGVKALQTIRDKALELANALKELDSSPASMLFGGVLPGLWDEESTRPPNDSSALKERRFSVFTSALCDLSTVADQYTRRDAATTQKRKPRSDNLVGKSAALCWNLLWNTLVLSGYPPGTGTKSPAIELLERVAEELDTVAVTGHPREMFRQKFKPPCRMLQPLQAGSDIQKKTRTPKARSSGDSFANMATQLTDPMSKGR